MANQNIKDAFKILLISLSEGNKYWFLGLDNGVELDNFIEDNAEKLYVLSSVKEEVHKDGHYIMFRTTISREIVGYSVVVYILYDTLLNENVNHYFQVQKNVVLTNFRFTN